MAPASTGKERSKRIAVIKIDHAKSGILFINKIFWCIFRTVEIKLIAPRIEDISAIWREEMTKSTAHCEICWS